MRPSDPKKGVWPTPDWLFQPLNARHRFDLDAAADNSNAKCARYFTVRTSALARPWTSRCFWNNPPYGTEPSTGVWVEYARHQVELGHAKSGCLLIPVKAETAWYQDAVWGDCRVVASRKVTDGPLAGRWYRLREPLWDVEVLELRGRVSFSTGGTKTETGFFASALVFFNAPARPALIIGVS
jgi:phage N-6-adenine-methyltransferase